MRFLPISLWPISGIILVTWCFVCGGCQRDCTNCPDNDSPRAVAVLEPVNQAVISDTVTALSWTAADPDGDSLTFDVYFGTTREPALVSLGQKSSTYEPSGLRFSTHYYWRVVVWDDDADSLASPLWEFETASEPYWQALGGGTNQVVFTLTEFQSQLIAGGFFREAEGMVVNRIAVWNGSGWQRLGEGVRMNEINSYATMATDAVVYHDRLFVCGRFDSAGTGLARGIATWDGSAWSDVGALDCYVLHIAVHNDRLYATGPRYFSSVPMRGGIASWDGNQWEPVGGGIPTNGIIDAIEEYDATLVFAGEFGTIDGLRVSSIVATDGDNWFSLGSGMNGRVESLCTYKGKLIAGGNFTDAGGTAVSNIACWDGADWTSLGEGMNGRVVSLIEYRGKLIAGGFFTAADGQPANHIAVWNGKRWSPLGEGADGAVWSFKVFNGRLIVGGQFDHIGGIAANNIASWGN